MPARQRSTSATSSVQVTATGEIVHLQELNHGGVVALLEVAGGRFPFAAWGRSRDTLLEVGVGGTVSIRGYVRSKAFIDRLGVTKWHLDLRAETVGLLEGGAR